MPATWTAIPFSQCLLLLPRELPAPQHGEAVDALRAVLLYRHRQAYRHPARGLLRRDADWLVRADAAQAAHVLDVSLRVVLLRRCPALDNHADGIEPVVVVVGAGEQLEGSPPAPRQRFKLYEGTVGLVNDRLQTISSERPRVCRHKIRHKKEASETVRTPPVVFRVLPVVFPVLYFAARIPSKVFLNSSLNFSTRAIAPFLSHLSTESFI